MVNLFLVEEDAAGTERNRTQIYSNCEGFARLVKLMLLVSKMVSLLALSSNMTGCPSQSSHSQFRHFANFITGHEIKDFG